jgi:hypothetical protein
MSVIHYDLHLLAQIYAIAATPGIDDDYVAQSLARFSAANTRAFNAAYVNRAFPLTSPASPASQAEIMAMARQLTAAREGRRPDTRELLSSVGLMNYNTDDENEPDVVEGLLVIACRFLFAARDQWGQK